MSTIHENILHTVGTTPLVRINKLCANPNVNIYAKIEGNNPTGSVKDRIALKMIEQAESAGVLTEDKIILEPSSGNTGIGLAMVAAVKSYKLIIIMSENVSIERRKMLKAYGAEVLLTGKDEGTDGAIRLARKMVAEDPGKYFMPDQFSNVQNKMAHYKTTGEEIWRQLNGKIDYFVSAMGTSGTLMGAGHALKENDSRIKIVCAHPVVGHHIQGLKNMDEAITPPILDTHMFDEVINVETEVAYETSRQIVKQEGIFVGMSSGAALFVANVVAKKIDKGNIVVIFPDRGEKYLSTALFPE